MDLPFAGSYAAVEGGYRVFCRRYQSQKDDNREQSLHDASISNPVLITGPGKCHKKRREPGGGRLSFVEKQEEINGVFKARHLHPNLNIGFDF